MTLVTAGCRVNACQRSVPGPTLLSEVLVGSTCSESMPVYPAFIAPEVIREPMLNHNEIPGVSSFQLGSERSQWGTERQGVSWRLPCFYEWGGWEGRRKRRLNVPKTSFSRTQSYKYSKCSLTIRHDFITSCTLAEAGRVREDRCAARRTMGWWGKERDYLRFWFLFTHRRWEKKCVSAS